ncbi:MAG: SEL1-like repeat protein [Alphaproteobacteria bacterium]|nr:SEL1-like repeat protein [Alphaproteobacteria bacterium]
MDRYLALVYLTEVGQAQDAWGELNRALKQFLGKGLPMDKAAAQFALDRVHKHGRAFSAFCFGFMHEHGVGVPADPDGAQRYYAKAAEVFEAESSHGLAASTSNLGFLHAQGKGVAQDQVRAARFFAEAAEKGFAPAQVNLGLCYLNGWGVEPDDGKAYALFQAAAEQGHGPVYGCIAHMMQHGQGGERNPVEAFRYLRLAAEAGDPKAWLELGHAYYVGLGTKPDFKKARKWLLLAAAHGDPGAQSMLGQMLAANAADAADAATAHQLLKQASDQGGTEAFYALGSFLLHGTRFTAANPAEAAGIADRLVELRSPLGARLNAEILEATKRPTPETLQGASRWYLEAARQGDPFSQAAIARRYEQGLGIERSPIEAYAWYRLAETFSTSGAAEGLTRLRNSLRAAEVQKAEDMARERRVRWSLDRELQFDRG